MNEDAIRNELAELRKQARRQAWEEAMQDPLFLKDVQEIEADLALADAEAAARLDLGRRQAKGRSIE